MIWDVREGSGFRPEIGGRCSHLQRKRGDPHDILARNLTYIHDMHTRIQVPLQLQTRCNRIFRSLLVPPPANSLPVDRIPSPSPTLHRKLPLTTIPLFLMRN